jgi:hypothetical protein
MKKVIIIVINIDSNNLFDFTDEPSEYRRLGGTRVSRGNIDPFYVLMS